MLMFNNPNLKYYQCVKLLNINYKPKAFNL